MVTTAKLLILLNNPPALKLKMLKSGVKERNTRLHKTTSRRYRVSMLMLRRFLMMLFQPTSTGETLRVLISQVSIEIKDIVDHAIPSHSLKSLNKD